MLPCTVSLQLLGAWLADSAWGRYKTILIFSSIYFLVGLRLRLHCCGQGQGQAFMHASVTTNASLSPSLAMDWALASQPLVTGAVPKQWHLDTCKPNLQHQLTGNITINLVSRLPCLQPAGHGAAHFECMAAWHDPQPR